MALVVVDTDVVSFVFKKDSRARAYRPHLVGRDLVVSFMTLAELRLWTLHRRWGTVSWQRLERHLQGYDVFYADAALCLLWAEIVAATWRKGNRIETADAWQAATALALDVPLVTHNPADYAAVDGLTVLTAAP